MINAAKGRVSWTSRTSDVFGEKDGLITSLSLQLDVCATPRDLPCFISTDPHTGGIVFCALGNCAEMPDNVCSNCIIHKTECRHDAPRQTKVFFVLSLLPNLPKIDFSDMAKPGVRSVNPKSNLRHTCVGLDTQKRQIQSLQERLEKLKDYIRKVIGAWRHASSHSILTLVAFAEPSRWKRWRHRECRLQHTIERYCRYVSSIFPNICFCRRWSVSWSFQCCHHYAGVWDLWGWWSRSCFSRRSSCKVGNSYTRPIFWPSEVFNRVFTFSCLIIHPFQHVYVRKARLVGQESGLCIGWWWNRGCLEI